VHPRNYKDGTFFTKGETSMVVSYDMSEYIHPNCMTFNKDGRLFVGDSHG